MRDVAFMPQGDVLQADNTICSNHSRYATDAFRNDRIAFMRHRAGTFLTFRKTFLRLANFGALPVTYVEGELFQRRGDDRERGQVLRVNISLNDLRGNCRRFQSKTRANTLFNGRIEMRKCSDRATYLSHRDCLSSAQQALAIAPHFVEPQSES